MVLGITGGIGSGKTVVSKLLQVWGIPVYNSDERAKKIIVENKFLISEIKKLLGDEAYLSDGSYNTKFVSSKVFNNQELLNEINRLVHPAVHQDFILWKEKQSKDFLGYESALLLQSKNSFCDAVIFVDSPLEMRIQRVLARDPQRSRELVLNIIQKQLVESEKIGECIKLFNDENQSIVEQLREILQKLNKNIVF